jgi:hypothetical protein
VADGDGAADAFLRLRRMTRHPTAGRARKMTSRMSRPHGTAQKCTVIATAVNRPSVSPGSENDVIVTVAVSRTAGVTRETTTTSLCELSGSSSGISGADAE